jgi:hypothetical protein
VLYFQLWGNGHETLDQQLDFDRPLARAVEVAGESALLEMAFVVRGGPVRVRGVDRPVGQMKCEETPLWTSVVGDRGVVDTVGFVEAVG